MLCFITPPWGLRCGTHIELACCETPLAFAFGRLLRTQRHSARRVPNRNRCSTTFLFLCLQRHAAWEEQVKIKSPLHFGPMGLSEWIGLAIRSDSRSDFSLLDMLSRFAGVRGECA